MLVLIFIKICSKARKPIITADDHRDVAVKRVVWGTVLLFFGNNCRASASLFCSVLVRICLRLFQKSKESEAATAKPGLKMKTKHLFTTLAALLMASSAFANFIDPERPTPADKLDAAALYQGGKLVLCFFDHYFVQHQPIDSDTLDITIVRHGQKEYREDDEYIERTKVYFGIILREVSGNMAYAKTAEERLEVYVKTKEWLAQVTGRDLSKYDNPPIAVEETKPLTPDESYSYYMFYKPKHTK
jgi:hypothetical protein